MESFEPKKLALILIWQILKEYSDYDHPLTQDDIAQHLENDYGIVIERKAISGIISWHTANIGAIWYSIDLIE